MSDHTAGLTEQIYFTETGTRGPEEVYPGVVVTRRRMLWLPALAAAALGLGGAGKTVAQEPPPPTRPPGAGSSETTKGAAAAAPGAELEWEEFLKQSSAAARELYKDASPRGQDAYLYGIAAVAARLRLASARRARMGRFGALDPPVHFGLSHRGAPFFVVEWWLEPGASLPPHCHPNVSVCTVGVEGEARVRNFEIVGAAPEFKSKEGFRVRESRSEVISPGRVNTLSASRDNIHAFQAGRDGARGIDISTYHGKDVGFSFLNIGDRPLDAERRLYEASWRAM